MAESSGTRYPVAVIGASFAGLAVARQLPGPLLLFDRAAPGAFQSSACALPLAWVRHLGLDASVRFSTSRFRCVMNGYEAPIELNEPFCTIDYPTFCTAGADLSHVSFVQSKVHRVEGHTLQTEQGPYEAEVIVNASGWNAVDRPGPPPPKGVGIETEIPARVDAFEFHFDRPFIQNGYGYAWAFPCGDTVRFGVIKYYGRHNLKTLLTAWLESKGLKVGATHGGAVPYLPQEPLVQGAMFQTGDAAGLCFPVTGEGIRLALYFGTMLGWLLRSWREGKRSLEEVRTDYRALVQHYEGKLRAVWKLQKALNRYPFLMGPLLRWGTRGPHFRLIANKYLHCFRPPADCETELARVIG